MGVDAEATTFELLEVAGLEGRADRPQLLAELRPQHRQIRLHPQLARVDRAELDVLHAQLLRDLACVRGDPVGALHD